PCTFRDRCPPNEHTAWFAHAAGMASMITSSEGALIPASLYLQAQRFRAWFRERVREAFREADVILAPTTPFPAPRIGAPRTTTVAGVEVVTRAHLGVFTQPLSFVGLPVISVPIAGAGPLPLGVQLVAA